MNALIQAKRTELCQALAEHLPACRKAYGLSQEEFGELLGKSRQAISLMERGVLNISWDTALAIVFILSSLNKEQFVKSFAFVENDATKKQIFKHFTDLL